MSPIRARKLSFILMGVALAALVLGLFLPQPFQAVGIAVGILGIVGWMGSLLFLWRCPDCHRMLPTQGMLGIRNCPYCGRELDEEH